MDLKPKESWDSPNSSQTKKTCQMCRMLWVQFLAHPILDNTWLKVKGQPKTHNKWYSQDSLEGEKTCQVHRWLWVQIYAESQVLTQQRSWPESPLVAPTLLSLSPLIPVLSDLIRAENTNEFSPLSRWAEGCELEYYWTVSKNSIQPKLIWLFFCFLGGLSFQDTGLVL